MNPAQYIALEKSPEAVTKENFRRNSSRVLLQPATGGKEGNTA